MVCCFLPSFSPRDVPGRPERRIMYVITTPIQLLAVHALRLLATQLRRGLKNIPTAWFASCPPPPEHVKQNQPHTLKKKTPIHISNNTQRHNHPSLPQPPLPTNRYNSKPIVHLLLHTSPTAHTPHLANGREGTPPPPTDPPPPDLFCAVFFPQKTHGGLRYLSIYILSADQR